MPSVLKPLQGDTALKQMLGQALLQSRSLVGEENFDNCLRRLTKSQELAEASAMEAAEAFAAFIKDVPTFAPTLKKRTLPKTYREAQSLALDLWKDEVVKGGKSGLRSMLLWRCAGWKLGLDEREALDRAFDEACRHCECGKEILTQMGNCWRKVCEEQAEEIAAEEVEKSVPNQVQHPAAVGTCSMNKQKRHQICMRRHKHNEQPLRTK